MEISVLGIDLAKSVFQLHGVNKNGKVVLRKKLGREKLLPFVRNLPACLIGMEACSGSSYWGREFEKLGHSVKLMAPQFVKPYIKSGKNDVNDAEGICEAVQRPTMRFVPIKQVDQQDIQGIHRIRERLVKARVALVNETRALLTEYGIVVAKNVGRLRSALPEILGSAENDLTSLARESLQALYDELCAIDQRLEHFTGILESIHNKHPICKRISKIPGIGPITSTILMASIGDPKLFKNGRDLAAWLGLVPKQHSSGGKTKLLGITKRGDPYIRKLLVQGARASLRWIENKEDGRSLWAKRLMERRGTNRAAVAIANKNARIVWVLLTREEEFRIVA